MRLKCLEIHGFKSFPDRTKINFSEGMTVIVGPNGSGKSNISDAIRWVLGEISAKNIRGHKLEDVIFGGTDNRSPMSFAEVSLTIENSGENRIENDFDEITVTRRYYRSGDSEYLINNKPARLRDITEMFMNTGIGKTGYSIVGQGRVSEIISQKSEERRIIFEEAAGISKYRYKKQDAERRLSETEDNLTRITDIVNELEGRIAPLEKDAAKARIYLDLYEKKKALDIAIAVFDIDRIVKSTESVERDYLLSKEELAIAEDALASFDTRIEKLETLQTENRIAFEKSTAESGTLTGEKHRLESELLVSRNNLEHLTEQAGTIRASHALRQKTLAQKQEDLAKIRNDHADHTTRLSDMEAVFEDLTSTLDQARAAYAKSEGELETLDAQRAEILRQHTEARITLSALDESKNTLQGRRDELTEDLSDADARILSTKRLIDASRQTLADYQTKISELESEKRRLSDKSDARRQTLAQMEERYHALLADISSKEQRAITLKRMEEHFEGYSRSVKFIADAAKTGRLRGICGPLSHLINVDRKYSVAIETSLGANLQNIVVENENAAKAAISLLKQENQGRSTFYPITSMRPARLDLNPSVKASAGYIGIASQLISYDPKYQPVISSLLGRTVIFDNLNNASVVAKSNGYAFRIVTLDGQIINAGGSFTGGSTKRDSGILTRSVEIDEILAAKAESEKKAAELKEKIDAGLSVSDEDKEEMERIAEDHALITALYKAEETGLNMHTARLTEQTKERDGLKNSLASIDAKEAEKAKQRAELLNRCRIFEETETAIGEQMSALLTAKDEASKRLNALISEKNDALVAISIQRKEVEVAATNLESLGRELETLQAEIEQGSEDLTRTIAKSAELSEKIEGLETELGEISEKLETSKESERNLTGKSLEIDKEINDLRSLSREKSREKEQIFSRYTTLSARMESIAGEKSKLTDRLWEEYELSYADALAAEYEPVTEETRGKKVSEQSKLRSKIRELGSVNVGAIEEYTQVKERYEFLSGQVNDLNKSKKEFSEIISKLEVEMCNRFSETFEQVNENFKEVFKALFDGGSGSLTLTDPENVLTSGIEINVTPPGKIIKNLMALSGGEQVFVAIGIFFAILKVNPSPFCLLDEIESALDEVNVDRFAQYAKEFTGNTQFIIITHRRGTMEEADTLYGVTMQERGISKILSISVNEVEQKLGVKL